MSPMPPPGMPPPAPAAAFSGLSAMTHSVVRNSAAMEAAFCSADRVTFAGAMRPSGGGSTYWPWGRGGRFLPPVPGDLLRVDYALGDHVDVLAVGGVQALAHGQVADLLHHDAALEAGVHRDLLDRGLERQAHDVRPGRLVAGQVELLERGLGGLQQRHATTGDDALLDSRLGVADGVLDAVLALLELDLGGRADLDHCDTAGQLGQALLQLLAVVVGVALLDLGADLADATGDLVGVAGTLDDRRLVLGDDDLAGAG